MIDLKELLSDVFVIMNKKSAEQKRIVIKQLKERGKLLPDETEDMQFLKAKEFFEID